jgi:hypothetical protein
MKTITACVLALLVCVSPVGAKRKKLNANDLKLQDWQLEGGRTKDWKTRACAIKNVLVVDNDLISGNVLWMHAFQPVAGEGIYAKAPEGVKVDGRLRYRESESDYQSDFDSGGGFAGTSTSYSLTLEYPDGTAIWSRGSSARHGSAAINFGDGGVSTRTVDEHPTWTEFLEELGRAANCPARKAQQQ